jgi:Flp pilus assembly protein TadG
MIRHTMSAAVRNRNAQRGGALIESALALLLFLSLVFAVFEFGRAVYSYNVLAAATREAARYAIVHGSSSSSPASNQIFGRVSFNGRLVWKPRQ